MISLQITVDDINSQKKIAAAPWKVRESQKKTVKNARHNFKCPTWHFLLSNQQSKTQIRLFYSHEWQSRAASAHFKKKKKMEPADVWDFCLQNDFTQSGWKLIFFPLTDPLNVAAVDARVDANSHLAVRSLYSVGWHLKCALDEESFRNATYFESEKYIQRCD